MTGAAVGLAAAARAAAGLAAALLVASCAPLPEAEHDGLEFPERQARLESIPAWEMRGRLAVDTGERAFQGRFRWLQRDGVSTLSVRSPLGANVLEASGSAGEMIVTARGERHVLVDPEEELSSLLGWWMPVESLRAWLLGLPDPDYAADARVSQSGVLRSLEQRLWRLEFDSYQLAEGLLVPRRIDMAHDEIELRLTVDAWSPESSP